MHKAFATYHIKEKIPANRNTSRLTRCNDKKMTSPKNIRLKLKTMLFKSGIAHMKMGNLAHRHLLFASQM